MTEKKKNTIIGAIFVGVVLGIPLIIFTGPFSLIFFAYIAFAVSKAK